jgi:hypothetical protein
MTHPGTIAIRARYEAWENPTVRTCRRGAVGR